MRELAKRHSPRGEAVAGHGGVASAVAQAAPQHRATDKAHQRVDVADLKRLRHVVVVQTVQALHISLQWPCRVAGEQARGEDVEPPDAQAFAPHEDLAAGGLDALPVGAGTSVDQHAHQRQVDLRAGPYVGRDVAQQVVQLRAPVHSAGFDVAPA